MQLPPVPPKRLAVELGLVFAAVFMWQWILQFTTPHMTGADGYYHIKVAWLFRTQGIFDDFPWATASLWRDHFYDKDFGFHVLLMPFTFGELVRGAKAASVFYSSIVYLSFYAVLRLNRVRLPVLWLVLLMASGGYWGFRTLLTRPHIVSIALSLWAAFLVTRRNLWGMVALTVAYALSYTAPHVVVVYVVIDQLAGRVRGEAWDWRFPAGALGAILLGWLLHPHFPENFIGWWVQNVQVLSLSWTGGHNLSLAGELHAADTRTMVSQNVSVVLVALGSVVVLPFLRGRITRRMLTLFGIAVGFGFMTAGSKRFVEYSVPFGLWVGAEVLSAALGMWHDAGGRRLTAISRRVRITFWWLVIAVVATLLWRSWSETAAR